MMEQIEIEIGKLKNKTAFAREASKIFNLQASSIINHWIGGLAIPKGKQNEFYKYLVKYNAKEEDGR